LLCGLIYLLAFSSLASVLFTHFGFPLDDSWIHQVIARNFAQYHVLGFTPGKLTSGSTSLLWTMVLSAGQVLFPKLSPVIFCMVLNGLLLACIGVVLKTLTEADGIPEEGSWCLALAPAMSGNFLWLGLTGMEHVLFLLLCCVLIERWTMAPERRDRRDGIVLFLLGLVLVSTRPEGSFLVALLVMAGTILPRSVFGRSVVDRALAVMGAGCSLAITAWVNWKTSGKFAPPTMAGRRLLAPTRLNYLMQSWFQLLKNWDYRRFSPEYVRHPRMAVELPIFVVLGCLMVIALWRLGSLHGFRFLFLCFWGATVVVLYGLELPAPGQGGRYIALPAMVCMSLVVFGIATALGFVIRSRRGLVITTATVMLVMGAESMYQWRIAMAADVDQINSEHGKTAAWLEAALPPEEFARPRVGVFDIGRIGYNFRGNILDLGALVDPEFLPYLLSHRTVQYLQQHEVDYLVIPGRDVVPPGRLHTDDMRFEELLSLKENPEVSLTLLQAICVDPKIESVAANSSGTAFPCQRIYRIAYNTALISPNRRAE
jgi:hypothetical protein